MHLDLSSVSSASTALTDLNSAASSLASAQALNGANAANIYRGTMGSQQRYGSLSMAASFILDTDIPAAVASLSIQKNMQMLSLQALSSITTQNAKVLKLLYRSSP